RRLADIAGVYTQAGGAGLGGLDGAAIMEMDVGDDRHRAFAGDLAQRLGRGFVRGRDAHDVGARIRGGDHLRQRGAHVRGIGVGHGLDADRGIAPDRDRADHDLPRPAALDIAPGADRVMRHRWTFRLSTPQIGAWPGQSNRQPTLPARYSSACVSSPPGGATDATANTVSSAGSAAGSASANLPVNASGDSSMLRTTCGPGAAGP